MKIVWVLWDDASQGEEEEDLDKDCLQATVGMLVKRDRYNWVLWQNYNNIDGRYQNFMRIPKKYIKDHMVVAEFKDPLKKPTPA